MKFIEVITDEYTEVTPLKRVIGIRVTKKKDGQYRLTILIEKRPNEMGHIVVDSNEEYINDLYSQLRKFLANNQNILTITGSHFNVID